MASDSDKLCRTSQMNYKESLAVFQNFHNVHETNSYNYHIISIIPQDLVAHKYNITFQQRWQM